MDVTSREGQGASRPARPQRPERAFVKAQRHSRNVRILKVALPVAALVMVAAFAGVSYLRSATETPLDIGGVGFEGGELVMDNPELDGFTADDLPYRMTASRAIQAVGKDSAIRLEEIRARVPIDESNWASIDAATGTYDRQRNLLDINSPVMLETTSGIVARLDSAMVDIATSELTTDKPVEIELDGTHIAADSLKAEKGGKVLVFKDRVRVNILPSRLRNSRQVSARTEAE